MRHSAPGTGLAIAAMLSILALPALAGNAFEAEQSMRTSPDANSIGIWKACVPRGMKAELNNYDPIRLIAGALIHADWVAPIKRAEMTSTLLKETAGNHFPNTQGERDLSSFVRSAMGHLDGQRGTDPTEWRDPCLAHHRDVCTVLGELAQSKRARH